MRRVFAIAVAATVALVGCSTTTATGPCAGGGSVLAKIQKMSQADLAAAQAKAKAAGDDAGGLCWQHLGPIATVPGAGIASTIEDARIAQMAAAGPCAGLLGGFLPVLGTFF